MNMRMSNRGKRLALGLAGLVMATMHHSADAMMPAKIICKHIIASAANDGGDAGFKCVSNSKRKLVVATLPPNPSKISQVAWAAVKGFVRATNPARQEGWNLVFEVAKGSCMGMSESDAVNLGVKFPLIKTGSDHKEFTADALKKIKSVGCELNLLDRLPLPKVGGPLCDSLERASKLGGGLAAHGVDCRQVGQTAHIEMKAAGSIFNLPSPYFDVMARAGRSWKAAGPDATLSIALDAQSDPSRCMLVQFEAFKGIAKVDSQNTDLISSQNAKSLADQEPSSFGMAVMMPILEFKRSPNPMRLFRAWGMATSNMSMRKYFFLQ